MLTFQDTVTTCTLRLNRPKPGFHLVKAFFVTGAIVPIVLVALEISIPDFPTNGPFGWLRVAIWPMSILATGTQCSYFTVACLYSVLLNIPFYLALGCLVWSGLQPPRSTVYLTFVGIMYLTIVGVAKFCEWLLT